MHGMNSITGDSFAVLSKATLSLWLSLTSLNHCSILAFTSELCLSKYGIITQKFFFKNMSTDRLLEQFYFLPKVGLDHEFFKTDFITVPKNNIKEKNQSLLYSLNTLSGVTGEWCPSPRLCAKTHTSRLQPRRVVGNVWDI